MGNNRSLISEEAPVSTATTRTAAPWWQFYPRVLAFLLPSLMVWAFAVRFVYPKVQRIWMDGGATGSEVQWMMDSVTYLVEYGWFVACALALAVVTCELLRARYRQIVAGSVVVLLNSTVLLGLA